MGDIGLSLQRHAETIGADRNTTPLMVGNGGASDAWPIGEVATEGATQAGVKEEALALAESSYYPAPSPYR